MVHARSRVCSNSCNLLYMVIVVTREVRSRQGCVLSPHRAQVPRSDVLPLPAAGWEFGEARANETASATSLRFPYARRSHQTIFVPFDCTKV